MLDGGAHLTMHDVDLYKVMETHFGRCLLDLLEEVMLDGEALYMIHDVELQKLEAH